MSRQDRKPRRAAALILSLAALLAVPATAAADGCPNAGTQPDPAVLSQSEYNDAILCLLNQQRSGRGLPALRMNDRLSSAAQGHSTSMNQEGYFSHDSPNGSGFESRITETGYLRKTRAWAVGENIAWGSWALGTPAAIVSSWMKSPPHRANILQRRFREIGVGVDWGSPVGSEPDVAATVTTDFGYSKR
jgi:uncharacterized protein YkwD